MTRDQLEHAIRASCAVTGDTRVYVLGSQSVLGALPDAPEALRQSMEVDVIPANHPERVDEVNGSLGQLSRFHASFGFYVDGMRTDEAIIPQGWQDRVVEIRNANTNGCTGACLSLPDLAASKLAAFREKDREFVRVLLAQGLVSAEALRDMLALLPMDLARREQLSQWVQATLHDA